MIDFLSNSVIINLSNQLLDPSLTTEWVVFALGFMAILMFAGIKIYSSATIISVGITSSILVASILFDITIVYFYLMLLITSFILMLSAIQYNQLH